MEMLAWQGVRQFMAQENRVCTHTRCATSTMFEPGQSRVPCGPRSTALRAARRLRELETFDPIVQAAGYAMHTSCRGGCM